LFAEVSVVRENPDPYLVLGVPSSATQAEIIHAYRTQLRAHHPDTRPSPSSHTADERLRQLLAAYAMLRDPARRAAYDRAAADAAKTRPHSPIVVPTSAGRHSSEWVEIPITRHRRNAPKDRVSPPPLRVGPVRRHR
jgi:curved DNA-binding protein CbpA